MSGKRGKTLPEEEGDTSTRSPSLDTTEGAIIGASEGDRGVRQRPCLTMRMWHAALLMVCGAALGPVPCASGAAVLRLHGGGPDRHFHPPPPASAYGYAQQCPFRSPSLPLLLSAATCHYPSDICPRWLLALTASAIARIYSPRTSAPSHHICRDHAAADRSCRVLRRPSLR